MKNHFNHWHNLPRTLLESHSWEILPEDWMFFLKDMVWFKQELIQGCNMACILQEVRLENCSGSFWLHMSSSAVHKKSSNQYPD